MSFKTRNFSARPTRRRAAAPKPNTQEARSNALVDRVALFEAFEANVMPILKDAMLESADPKKVMAIGKTAAAIQLVLKAQSGDLAAIKDLLDRTEGKAIERKQIAHAMKDVKTEQLDALLLSALEDVSDDTESSDG